MPGKPGIPNTISKYNLPMQFNCDRSGLYTGKAIPGCGVAFLFALMF
jgi:hypothetical protein